MPRRTNFADPAYEPTDEELQQLVQEAFADVEAGVRRGLADMWARIHDAQAEARRRLRERAPA